MNSMQQEHSAAGSLASITTLLTQVVMRVSAVEAKLDALLPKIDRTLSEKRRLHGSSQEQSAIDVDQLLLSSPSPEVAVNPRAGVSTTSKSHKASRRKRRKLLKLSDRVWPLHFKKKAAEADVKKQEADCSSTEEVVFDMSAENSNLAISQQRSLLAKRNSRRMSNDRRVSWHGSQVIPVESFRELGAVLWYESIGRNVACDTCGHAVPQCAGAMLGGKSQFTHDEFKCRGCIAQQTEGS